MDLNSFMNTKSATGPKPKEFEEIVDLKAAYDFARTHELTEKNMLEAHAMLAKRIVSAGNQGVYRTDKVGVFSSQGLVYMAVEHEKVAGEMQKLFADIAALSADSAAEALYYASLAHLRFAEIHPLWTATAAWRGFWKSGSCRASSAKKRGSSNPSVITKNTSPTTTKTSTSA
jgi:hypothetical protein